MTKEEAITILSNYDLGFYDINGHPIPQLKLAEACDMAIEALSADAVQGEWLRKYDEEINCYWYECNRCGSRPPLDQWRHEWHSEYCPNCGAKMLGEDGEA